MNIKPLHPEQRKEIWDLLVAYCQESPDLLLDKLHMFCNQSVEENKYLARSIEDVISFINSELEYCICVKYNGVGNFFYSFKNNDILTLDKPLNYFFSTEQSTLPLLDSQIILIADHLLKILSPNLTGNIKIYSYMNTLISGLRNFAINGYYNSANLNITTGCSHPFYVSNTYYLKEQEQEQKAKDMALENNERLLHTDFVPISVILPFHCQEKPEILLKKKRECVDLGFMKDMLDNDFLYISTGNNIYIEGKNLEDLIHLIMWNGQVNEFHNFINTLFEDFDAQRWSKAKTSCRINGKPIPKNIRQNSKVGSTRLVALNKVLAS
jgi:hypothetical protein